MNRRLKTGFIAGSLGAIILVVVMYLMKAAGMGEPGFVGMYKAMFGANPPADQFIAAGIFIISGGIWGIVFAYFIKRPTILKGILFGLLPTLWLWIVVNAVIGKPLFNNFDPKGLILPMIFNMLIWGSFVGWYMKRKSSWFSNF